LLFSDQNGITAMSPWPLSVAMVQDISFQEFQTFSDARVLVAIGITAVPLSLLGPFSVVGWLISGLVALLLLSVQLRTEVQADGICLRYWPLHRTF